MLLPLSQHARLIPFTPTSNDVDECARMSIYYTKAHSRLMISTTAHSAKFQSIMALYYAAQINFNNDFRDIIACTAAISDVCFHVVNAMIIVASKSSRDYYNIPFYFIIALSH